MRACFPLLLMLATVVTPAQDWTQWRGENRNGAVAGVELPSTWPERLTKKWSLEVGEGHSSPLVVGERVYQFSRFEDQESIAAIALDAGRVIWRKSYPAPYTMNSAARAHGKGPKSTPVAHGGRLYTLGISGILSCFDFDSGDVVWQKDFSDHMRSTSPLYGTAMSPIVEGKALIAHVGGHGGGALTAFDLDTGEEIWSWTGDGPGYASPIIVDLDGTRQLVTQTESKIVSVSPDGGRLLWEMEFTTPWVQNIVTPVVDGEALLFGGLSNPTMRVEPKLDGGRWTTKKVWENKDAPIYMSTPALVHGILFGFSNRNSGQFFAQDPDSGEILWRGAPRAGANAAILASDNTVLALTVRADLIIAKMRQGDVEKLASYSVADTPTWAHPVVLEDGFLIKDENSLIRWTW